MTLLKNILHKFKNLILFLLPIIYISYILYLRLIIIRPERKLFIPLSNFQIILTLVIIIILLIRIYFLLKKLEIIKNKEKKHFLVLWCLKKAAWFYEKFVDIWLNFYRYFVVKSKNAVRNHLLLQKFGEFLSRHENPTFMLTLIIIFQVLPKIIVVTAFLMDIFIFKEFYYFYKVLFLLLLPLVSSTLRSMLLQFYEDNYAYFKEIVEIDLIPIENSVSYRIKYSFVEGYEPASFVKNLADFIDNHYLPITRLELTINYYDATLIYYKIYYVYLLINILYVIGWSIILIYGIKF